MPGNIDPIYTKEADNQWAGAALTAANTARNGTGTVNTVWTADATNGGYCQFIQLSPLGTNVQTVARIFENNGSTNATAANNTLIAEVTCPATTTSETVALFPVAIPMNRAFNPGHKLNIVFGTAVAAGFHATSFAGKF